MPRDAPLCHATPLLTSLPIDVECLNIALPVDYRGAFWEQKRVLRLSSRTSQESGSTGSSRMHGVKLPMEMQGDLLISIAACEDISRYQRDNQ
jgi:hypothetical protein